MTNSQCLSLTSRRHIQVQQLIDSATRVNHCHQRREGIYNPRPTDRMSQPGRPFSLACTARLYSSAIAAQQLKYQSENINTYIFSMSCNVAITKPGPRTSLHMLACSARAVEIKILHIFKMREFAQVSVFTSGTRSSSVSPIQPVLVKGC